MERVTLIRVLVASPGDVTPERQAIHEAILDWNLRYSHLFSAILQPVLWERSAPIDSAQPPQALINKYIVDRCDICIGVFWSRLGTPTTEHPGGTVEEIDRCIRDKKPTMIYFCKRRPPPEAKAQDIRRVEKYKADVAARLYGEFTEPEELGKHIKDRLEYFVKQALERQLVSHFAGKWIQVKDKSAGRPYALVDIGVNQDGLHSVSGRSYTAEGAKGVRWPSGELNFTFITGSRLYHTFDAEHGDTQAIGVSAYDVREPPEGRLRTGSGFYVHHVQGPSISHATSPQRFDLVEVSPELTRRLIQRDEITSDDEKAHFVNQFHIDHIMRRVVITGGAHSGKTLLVNALREMGYSVTEEAALGIIQMQLAQRGQDGFHEWAQTHFAEYQMQIFDRHCDNEREIGRSLTGRRHVLQDRSGIDCIAYLERRKIVAPQKMKDYAASVRIEHVFVLDTIEPFDGRPETGRTSNIDDSRAIRNALVETYLRFGHSPHIIEQDTISKRVERIASILRSS